MKIEVWSDFVCPFCYIGKRHLEAALADLNGNEQSQCEVIYKSFELDPNAAKNSGQTIHEKLAEKYGRSFEEAKEMTKNMETQASEAGLDFHFDTMIPTNTFDAHRAAKLAESKGIGKEAAERFFSAVFKDSVDISDHDSLIQATAEIGLEQQEMEELLNGTPFAEVVRSEEAEAQQLGVQGVPFFVINRKYAISGAQPIEVFKNALTKVLEEEQKSPAFEDLSETNDTACTDDSC